MRSPKVLNASKVGLATPNSVYVGRPGLFGNPFVVGQHGARGECLKKFEEWILAPAQQWLVNQAKAELRGKDLICFCAPKPCHAGIWIKIVNGDN